MVSSQVTHGSSSLQIRRIGANILHNQLSGQFVGGQGDNDPHHRKISYVTESYRRYDLDRLFSVAVVEVLDICSST
jgi:hypothetical protein